MSQQRIGIARIGHCDPNSRFMVPNSWFAERGLIKSKFPFYSGIEQRGVAKACEEEMGSQAVRDVLQKTGYPAENVKALIFVSNSFVPDEFARRLWYLPHVQWNSVTAGARRTARKAGLRLRKDQIVGVHWGCSGFARAMCIIQNDLLPRMSLSPTDAIIVVAATRTSRISDFSDRVIGPVFGDYATASLFTFVDNPILQPRLELVGAMTATKTVTYPTIECRMKRHVVVPTEDGGERVIWARYCFSLNGDILLTYAPQIMASAAGEGLDLLGIDRHKPSFLVPHQTGPGTGRWFEEHRQKQGITGEVINGHSRNVGNISSCSLPFTLSQAWGDLHGLVVCPTSGVGNPRSNEMSCGCAVFQTAN